MDKNELITMLQLLVNNCCPTTSAGKPSTMIYDVAQDSFIWVLEETIELLREGE